MFMSTREGTQLQYLILPLFQSTVLTIFLNILTVLQATDARFHLIHKVTDEFKQDPTNCKSYMQSVRSNLSIKCIMN